MVRWGQIDIMMDNAAVPGADRDIWEHTHGNWNGTLAVNLTTAMLCSHELLQNGSNVW
jgi:3-oxoacyl-[acyl-carrier protein] reductase